MNVEECLARLEQTEHEVEEAAILGEFYVDARADPLAVLRAFLNGCEAAAAVHSKGDKCFWCSSDSGHCSPNCTRARAEALLTGAPARTEPTALEVAERVRWACAQKYCPDCLVSKPEWDELHGLWVHANLPCGAMRIWNIKLAMLLAEPGPAGGDLLG